jgi:membrane-bound acyltransferase YfiQ involved in biofilm formation
VLRNSTNRAFPESSLLGNYFELLLTFGTPAFIFISEMILAHSSRNSANPNNWSNRIRFILAPYFLFGAVYACMKAAQSWAEAGEITFGTLFTLLWRHWLLGDYHGYFILIVFQFYVLHSFMQKLDNKYSPRALLALSLIVNLIYLGFFNFVPSPDSAILHYVWSKYYWIPFPGWAFYFVLAYYCGSRYETFKKQLVRHGKWGVIAILLSGAFCYVMLQQGWISSVSSKRIDMVFFTVSAIFIICYTMIRLGKVSPLFIHISRYSFGIYLLHPMFLAIMFVPLQMFPSIRSNWLTVAILFVGSIGSSVVVTALLNKTRWGPYIIGKVKQQSGKKSKEASVMVANKMSVGQ